jgi:ketosteroid isomerase-like protein
MGEFSDAVRSVQDAANTMTNGDPKPYVEAWAHDESVSLMGAWGGHEVGWRALEERFQWVASRFAQGSAMEYEPILSHVGAEVAYTVGIERGVANADGATAPMAIRVTHIYRQEQGAWKLVHRHADFAVDKQPPPG